MSESEVYTIGDFIKDAQCRKMGIPTDADLAYERRRLEQEEYVRKQRERADAKRAKKRTEKRRAALGFDPTKVKVTVSRKAEPANIVTKTGEIVKNTGRMTKAEFDGSKAKHDKIMERDASGNRVHNCAAAKTYRHQVWEYMSKQRDDAGNLIRTEHPDAKAVQLAGI